MNFADLPKPLADWLDEIEIFSPRMSRMHGDAQLGGDAMLKWLVAAYEIGLSEGRGSVSREADTAGD